MALGEPEVCDGRHRLVVMKKSRGLSTAVKQNPKIDTTVESQVSKTARPGAAPIFLCQHLRDNTRYTRAGDVGHPPKQHWFVDGKQVQVVVGWDSNHNLIRAWEIRVVINQMGKRPEYSAVP